MKKTILYPYSYLPMSFDEFYQRNDTALLISPTGKSGRGVVENGRLVFYNLTHDSKYEGIHSLNKHYNIALPRRYDGTVLDVLCVKLNKNQYVVYLFDILTIGNEDITHYPYGLRLHRLRVLLNECSQLLATYNGEPLIDAQERYYEHGILRLPLCKIENKRDMHLTYACDHYVEYRFLDGTYNVGRKSHSAWYSTPNSMNEGIVSRIEDNSCYLGRWYTMNDIQSDSFLYKEDKPVKGRMSRRGPEYLYNTNKVLHTEMQGILRVGQRILYRRQGATNQVLTYEEVGD